MPDHAVGPEGELLHVSALNQFLYCQRRYWYYRFYPPTDQSPAQTQGRHQHAGDGDQSGAYREVRLVAPDIGLHGRVDLLDTEAAGSDGQQCDDGESESLYHPVERKRGGDFYWNDEVQLAAYALLIEEALDVDVALGYIYTRSTDVRHEIRISEDHREAVRAALANIRNLDPGTPPQIVENPNKCRHCSVRHYCLPRATARTDPDTAPAAWQEVIGE